MLALTRHPHQRVRLRYPNDPTKGEIWVRVEAVRGDKVRISFEVPDDCEILREELIVPEASYAEVKDAQ